MTSPRLVTRIFPCQCRFVGKWRGKLVDADDAPFFSHLLLQRALKPRTQTHVKWSKNQKPPHRVKFSKMKTSTENPKIHTVWEISKTTPKSVPFLLFLSTISLTFSSFKLRPRQVPSLHCDKLGFSSITIMTLFLSS